jgi:hypothetical protein
MFHPVHRIVAIAVLALSATLPASAQAQTAPAPASLSNVRNQVMRTNYVVHSVEFIGKNGGFAMLTIHTRTPNNIGTFPACNLRSADEMLLLKIQQTITDSRGAVSLECATDAPGNNTNPITIDLSNQTAVRYFHMTVAR